MAGVSTNVCSSYSFVFTSHGDSTKLAFHGNSDMHTVDRRREVFFQDGACMFCSILCTTNAASPTQLVDAMQMTAYKFDLYVVLTTVTFWDDACKVRWV